MHLRLFHGCQHRATKFEVKDNPQSFSDTGPVRLNEKVIDIHLGVARSTSTPHRQCVISLERIHFDTKQCSHGFLNTGEALCATPPQL